MAATTEFLDRVNSRAAGHPRGTAARASAFIAAMVENDLLESFVLDVELDDGSQNRLAGFHTINEERLGALGGDALERLQQGRPPAGGLHGDRLALAICAASSTGRTALNAGTASDVKELSGIDPQALPDEVLRSTQPVVLRGLVARLARRPGRPASRRRRGSATCAGSIAMRPVDAMLGTPEIGGRFFYNDDLSALNFRHVRAKLDAVLDEIGISPGRSRMRLRSTSARPPSTPACPDFATRTISASATAIRWRACGSATARASPRTTTCPTTSPAWWPAVAASPCSRREQLGNLYVGPLDLHAGRAGDQPGRFRQARLCALPPVREGAASTRRSPNWGRATRSSFPACGGTTSRRWSASMCWSTTGGASRPATWIRRSNALMHAILSVRDLPPEQRAAWQRVFDHYVFDADDAAAAHIPGTARGAAGVRSMRTSRGQHARPVCSSGSIVEGKR